MRVCTCTLIACLVMVGCTTTSPDSLATENQGIAELRVDAAALAAASVTRVTVDTAGQTEDLAFNPVTGTFDAALFLPSGTQRLVAHAFSGDTLVGASSQVSVEVTPGLVTRVVLRILDLTVTTPVFGPIFDSLTFPTTAQAASAVRFSISVLAPAGDPVTYGWTSDCADSTFTTPSSATTSWSKPAQGSCRIDVVATSNGFAVSQSFMIVVFPAGTQNGAVNVSGVFVTGPSIGFSLDTLHCNQSSDFPGNASCPETIASPSTTTYSFSTFSWGVSTAGSLELSDSCGGRFGWTFRNSDFIQGSWLPPASGGLCILSARATNSDGVATTVSSAVLTRAGTTATAMAPQVFVSFGPCFFSNNDPSTPTSCPPLPASAPMLLSGSVGWVDGIPGTVTITDSCGGGRFQSDSSFSFTRSWPTTSAPGTTCSITVDAVNLQGVESVAAAQYQLF